MQIEARDGVVVMEEGRGGVGVGGGHGAVVVDGGAAGAAHKLTEQQKQRTFYNHNHQSHIGTVSQVLAGGVAGAVGHTCTAPLARLTILFQIQGMHSDSAILKKARIWQEARRMIREEGFQHSGREICSQLFIGCPILLSAFMHSSTIRICYS